MPPRSPQYTVVGFSPELDWRPLTFVKPVPANRVCSACGLVRKKTMLLPCMHVLCECCYDQCEQDSSHECPLDGNHYEERDVDVKDFPDEDLLSRAVKCWNEGNGCQYATAASGITRHVLRGCEHHSVRCPKCSAIVLCGDVCTHLRSASCNTSTPPPCGSQAAPSHLDERALLTNFNATFQRQADEIFAHLRSMAADICTHTDSLSEISDGINTLKETLKEELEGVTEQINDRLTESATEMADLKEQFVTRSDAVNAVSRNVASLETTLNDEFSLTRDNFTSIGAAIEKVFDDVKESGSKIWEFTSTALRHSELQIVQCVLSVKEVKSLQETAAEKWNAAYDSERVYLRGYCITPGVRFAKDGEFGKLQGRYTVHKGDMDEFVAWPFRHNIRLSVIHPKGEEDRSVECKPKSWAQANQKPTASSNDSYDCMYDDHLPLQALMTDGFIENDELRVKWQLLP